MKLATSSYKKIPTFIREEYPLFVKLVEYYYEFLEKSSHTGNLSSVKDLDNTEDIFLDQFRKQFSPEVPIFDKLGTRDFLKFAKGFYTSKGTEDSIKFLFRAMFGEEINIFYPSKQILKASDGKWHQEYHIEIEKLYSNSGKSSPELEVTLTFSNQRGLFKIIPIRVVETGTINRSLVFFELPASVIIEDNQIIEQHDEEGTLLFSGRVVSSPSKIRVVSPGKYWQIGQVIKVPGSIKDSYIRVSRTDSEGRILEVEVLEYGFSHSPNQSLIVSPFPNKPFGAAVDISTTIVGTNPLVRHHEIKVYDYLEGFAEKFTATSNEQDYFVTNTYFLEQYFGKTVASNSIVIKPEKDESVSDLTMEKWLESRATFIFEQGILIRDKGYYLDSDSLVSNSEIKLQDNFYYQNFSYVLDTENELKNYVKALNQVHPSGLKYFGQLIKIASIRISPEVKIVFDSDLINKLDEIDIQSYLEKFVTKEFADSNFDFQDNSNWQLTKLLFDQVLVPDYLEKTITTRKSDSVTLPDYLEKNFVKPKKSQYQVLDTRPKLNQQKDFADSLTSIDSINIEAKKPFSDSVGMTMLDTTTHSIQNYFDGTYFENGNYFTLNHTLEIK